MRANTVHHEYKWTRKYLKKEIDWDTGKLLKYEVWALCTSTRTTTYYNDITRGRAKRIARNHYLRFRPRDCGTGFSKMKDKKYLPSAGFVYTSHNRKLVIRINGTLKEKILSKVLIEDTK